jgi:hypothetical protein
MRTGQGAIYGSTIIRDRLQTPLTISFRGFLLSVQIEIKPIPTFNKNIHKKQFQHSRIATFPAYPPMECFNGRQYFIDHKQSKSRGFY